MNDTCEQTKISDQNITAHKTNADTSGWKFFNSFEKKDMKKK